MALWNVIMPLVQPILLANIDVNECKWFPTSHWCFFCWYLFVVQIEHFFFCFKTRKYLSCANHLSNLVLGFWSRVSSFYSFFWLKIYSFFHFTLVDNSARYRILLTHTGAAPSVKVFAPGSRTSGHQNNGKEQANRNTFLLVLIFGSLPSNIDSFVGGNACISTLMGC